MLHLTKKQYIETALILAMAILVLAWYYEEWSLIVPALGVLFLGLLLPLIFYPLAFLWFGLSKVLGFISSHILLILAFFLLVVPIGTIRKWMGKDSLLLKKFKKETSSVFKNRDHLFDLDDLRNTF